MMFASVIFTILASLALAALAGPVYRSQAIATRNFIPEHIVWQSNANRTHGPMVPNFGSVKACQRITYYSGTPASGIRRSDCQNLVYQMESDPGYVSNSWCSIVLEGDTNLGNGSGRCGGGTARLTARLLRVTAPAILPSVVSMEELLITITPATSPCKHPWTPTLELLLPECKVYR